MKGIGGENYTRRHTSHRAKEHVDAFDSINQHNGEDIEDPMYDDDDASHGNIVSEADDDEQGRRVVHEHL